MTRYKDTHVGKSSALAAALDKGDQAEAKKVYDETTQRYKAMFSEEDRVWFAAKSKE